MNINKYKKRFVAFTNILTKGIISLFATLEFLNWKYGVNDFGHGRMSLSGELNIMKDSFWIATLICFIVELIAYIILLKDKKEAIKIAMLTNIVSVILVILGIFGNMFFYR